MLLQMLVQQASNTTYLPGCGLVMGPLCAYLTAKKGYPTKDIVMAGIAGLVCWPLALVLVIAQKDKKLIQQQNPSNIPAPYHPQQPYGQQSQMPPSGMPQQASYPQPPQVPSGQQPMNVQQPRPEPSQPIEHQVVSPAPIEDAEPEVPSGKKRCPACSGLNSESYKRCLHCGLDF